MFPIRVLGTRSIRYLRLCLALMELHVLYTNEKMHMGLYWPTVCADGVFAKAATRPVTVWVGQGDPASMHSMRAIRSDMADGGMCRISCFDTPSGPMAANFPLAATAFVNCLAVIGGNSVVLGGMACFMKSTIVSHC